MLSGIIDRNRFGYLVVHVNGYPRIQYIGYTKRESIQKYRLDHGLIGKHINFCDMCERSYFATGKENMSNDGNLRGIQQTAGGI